MQSYFSKCRQTILCLLILHVPLLLSWVTKKSFTSHSSPLINLSKFINQKKDFIITLVSDSSQSFIVARRELLVWKSAPTWRNLRNLRGMSKISLASECGHILVNAIFFHTFHFYNISIWKFLSKSILLNLYTISEVSGHSSSKLNLSQISTTQ